MDLNSISSYLKCPLCTKLFENPKLLPCGHNLCEKCLKCHIIQTVPMTGYDIFDYLNEHTDEIKPAETCFKCPIDGEELTPDNPALEVCKWAAQFENNLKMVTLLEICKGKERSVIEYCDVCTDVSQEMTATSVCFTCAEKYCVKCAFIHRHTHSNDSLFDLCDIQSISSDNTDIANPPVKTCNFHLDFQLSMFCLGCKEKCCTVCQQTTHIGCKHVTGLNTEYGDSGASDSLEQLINRFKSASSEISMIMKDDLELFDRANSLINTDTGVNLGKFDDMLDKLDELKCQISRWQMHYEQTQQSLKYLNEEEHEPSRAQTRKRIQTEIVCLEIEKVIEYNRKHKTDNREKLQQIEDVLNENCNNKNKDNVKMPKMRNKNLRRMRVDTFDQLLDMKTDSIEDISTHVHIVDKIDIGMDNDENNCWLTDCLFVNVDFFIVADKANECIKWKYKNDQVDKLALKSGPQCLAADEHRNTGCITLPDDKMIQFFCIKDGSINLIHQLKTKERCYGVDFIGSSWIAVSYQQSLESGVCILDEKGTEIRSFSKSEDITYGKLFSDPRYIKAQMCEDEFKIYVTDFGLHTVTCITLKGLEGKFSTKDLSHHKMNSPLGIDIDQNDNLLVCSNSTGNVLQILCTSKDERQHRLLTNSLWLPRAVSFLKGRNRFVVTSDSGPCKNHVLVYELTSKVC